MEQNTNVQFLEKHKEYSIYADWPPFSTSYKKRSQYLEDVDSEIKRIASKINSSDDDAYERMFSTLEVKWQDDLDEARLYQKRYGSDRDAKIDAFLAALKAEGRTEDSPDIPFGIF